MAKSGEPASVDREATTERVPSGSFMVLAARAEVLKAALAPCMPHTRDAVTVLEALRVEIDAVIVDCEEWPELVSADATDRLAWTATMSHRVGDLEARVQNFLTGGR